MWRDIELLTKIVSLVVVVVAPGLAAFIGEGRGVVWLEVDVQLLLVLLNLLDFHVQPFDLLGDCLVVPRLLLGWALGGLAAGYLGAFSSGDKVVAVSELVEL